MIMTVMRQLSQTMNQACSHIKNKKNFDKIEDEDYCNVHNNTNHYQSQTLIIQILCYSINLDLFKIYFFLGYQEIKTYEFATMTEQAKKPRRTKR